MKSHSAAKECVLFADDSKTARAAARKILQNTFDVVDASTGDEAWAQIKNNSDIRLVIADINMPDSNGFELLKKIRQSEDLSIAQLPVVIITGVENSVAAMRAALKLGATDFISKPFKGIDLVCRVQSYIKLTNKICKLEKLLKNGKIFDGSQIEQYELYAKKYLSFANRHKSSCSFGYIDIDVLNDIHTQHDKKILIQIQKLIEDKIKHHLREEDLFSSVSTHRFGLTMPATSQVKAQVLLIRLIDVINVISLEVRGEKYRLSAKSSVYTRNGIEQSESFESIMSQLDEAVIRCKNKIIVCGNSKHQQSAHVDQFKYAESLSHVLNGEYHKISEVHVTVLSNKFDPFMQYASNFGK